MATSKIAIDEGSTLNTATNTISEDAVTKHIPRSVLNTSAGAEAGTTASPLAIALPAATVTTLTPPAAISGFATSAKQLADGHLVALSATDNAVLDTIDTALDAINAKLVTGTDIGDVTINNSTGAAAVNIQDGGNIITVDGTVSVNAHAVTNAGTFVSQENGAALTALQLIDNMISGAEAQVDVITLPALAAGTANIGDVDVISFANGKTILRAVISGATSGDNTIIAGDATKKIKVLSLFLVAATAVTVRFEGGAGGTALTGVMSVGATGGFVLPAPADPTDHWFETAANTLLNMELGGAVQVSGAMTYYLEA